MKLQYKIIFIIIICVASFFAGRLTIKQQEIVKFVKGETVVQTIEVPKFIKETIPSLPVLKTKIDTLFVDREKIIIQTVDTQALIRDFIAKREYQFNVFNNENGKLDIAQTIQYNELQHFSYSFTPIEKNTIIKKEKVLTPFVSASYNTLGFTGIGGGLFYHNLGFRYNYMYNMKDKTSGHEIGIVMKF